MGNCHRSEFHEVDTPETKMSIENYIKRRKYQYRDPLLEFIKTVLPNEFLKHTMEHFHSIYKIKKNIKCQKDIMYKIRVLQNTLSGRLLNVKIISKSQIVTLGIENFKILFKAEINAFLRFKHPNAESLINVYLDDTKEDFELYLITNYTHRSSLLDLINEHVRKQIRFEENEISLIMKTLIETMYHMKTTKLIHRNLSPDNIFFAKENKFSTLCIRNFYFSTFVNKEQFATGVNGGLWYMAPEMIKDVRYDYKADVWSLGIIFYMITTLDNPFAGCMTRDSILDKLKMGQCFRSVRDLTKFGVNPVALNMIYKLLAEEPSSRINVELLIEEEYFKLNDAFNNEIHRNFEKIIDYDPDVMVEFKYKVRNVKEIHNFIFCIIWTLKDYFIELEELINLNDFYKFFDKNKDGTVKYNEIADMLSRDPRFNQDKVSLYLELLKVCIETDFHAAMTHATYIDYEKNDLEIPYDFFIVANIILKLYKEKDQAYSLKKVEIMFFELDEDKNGSIDVKEFENILDQNKDYKIKVIELFKLMVNKKNPYFDLHKIKDLTEFTQRDIKNLLCYNLINLTKDQRDEIMEIKRKMSIKNNKTLNTITIH